MRIQDTAFSNKVLQIFEQGSKPLLMGILNITPDSFFDGGKYLLEQEWLLQTEKMLIEGADIIDIGAYSSRPGAKHISNEEEWSRLKNVLPSLKKQFPKVCFSVDTFRSDIAKNAINEGAEIINDISGGTADSEMFDVISQTKVSYIIMHMQGTPQTMQNKPHYKNVNQEIYSFFEKKIYELNSLNFNKIILDPGFGFGKSLEHNYELLNSLEKFKSLNRPILVGLSRKSMITKLLNIEKSDALNGTTILNTIALLKGAKILRVHDVKEAKQIIEIFNNIKIRQVE